MDEDAFEAPTDYEESVTDLGGGDDDADDDDGGAPAEDLDAASLGGTVVGAIAGMGLIAGGVM